MTDTKNLIRQHNDVLAIIAKILAYQTDRQIIDNAFNITLLLGQLAGKLKVHMTTEDKFVYPALAAHPDGKVQQTSRMFADEMGNLATVFEGFKTKYLKAKEITANPGLFSRESKTVFAAVTKRIERENVQLYPLLD